MYLPARGPEAGDAKRNGYHYPLNGSGIKISPAMIGKCDRKGLQVKETSAILVAGEVRII